MATVGRFRYLLGGTLVLVGVLVVVPAETAGAVVVAIAPTITEDVVDPNDGQVSLREAFTLAATQAGHVRVDLGDHDYQLTLCGLAPEDLNAGGDLDIVATAGVLTITGTGSITNTCPDRGLLDISAPGVVIVSGLELSGGETVSQMVPTQSPGGVPGFALDGSPVTIKAAEVLVEGVDVHSNTIEGAGAAVAVTTWGSQVTPSGGVELRGVDIHSNTGGGFHTAASGVGGVWITIDDSVIRDNLSGANHGAPDAWAAGATVLGFSRVTLRDSTVTDNTFEPNGTGFQTGGLILGAFTDAEITRSQITDNTGVIGGLMASQNTDPVVPPTTSLEIVASDLQGNVGSIVGGGWLGADDLSIYDTTVSLNSHSGASFGSGGLYASGRNVDLDSLQVAYNQGHLGGAAVYGHDQLAVSDSTFEHNTGIALGGVVLSQNGWEPGSVVVERTRFVRNTTTGASATAGGGGWIDAYGPVSIVDSTVSNNSGDALGGLRVRSTTDRAHLVRSTFYRNTATAPDGVGALVGAEGDVRLSDTTVTNNTGAGVGGVRVEPQAHHLGLYNSTITWNTGNVEVAGTAQTESWMTVIGVPRTGRSNCVGVVHYRGSANYDTDASCNWRPNGGVSGGANPLLGPLRDNGGEVRTRLPDPGSPLLDVVPAQSALCGGLAANGVQRNDPDGCDIGAAERP